MWGVDVRLELRARNKLLQVRLMEARMRKCGLLPSRTTTTAPATVALSPAGLDTHTHTDTTHTGIFNIWCWATDQRGNHHLSVVLKMFDRKSKMMTVTRHSEEFQKLSSLIAPTIHEIHTTHNICWIHMNTHFCTDGRGRIFCRLTLLSKMTLNLDLNSYELAQAPFYPLC